MKKLTIILLTCFSAFICRSQENINNLNSNIKAIVFNPILEDLEVNLPACMAPPFNLAINDAQQLNKEIISGKDTPDLNILMEYTGLNRLELNRSLNIEFVPRLQADTTIQIQAKKKKKVLYTIKFVKEGNNETYAFTKANGSLSKEIIYQNGKLMSLNVIEPDIRYILINEKKDDNLFNQTVFNSKTGIYSLSDYFYQNNFLTQKVLYQSSASRTSRNIKRTWNYKYDSEGKILSISGFDINGVRTDSINYFYTGSILNSIVTYEKDAQSTVYYLPESGLISDYLFEGYENTKLHFEYNKEGKITRLLLNNSKKSLVENYIFEYNSSSNLVSIKKYVNQNISNDMIFKKQYIFSYNSEQMLTSMLITKKKGKIKKEIDFEINYLN